MNTFTTSVISVLPVDNYAAAKGWYASWLGRAPDVEPVDHVAEWQIADGGWIQVTADPAASGNTTVIIEVTDIDAQRAMCEAAGVSWGAVTDYGFIKTAEATDPAGNTVVFVQEVAKEPFDNATHESDVEVSMLIRKTPDQVFNAFADPDQIRQFWLAHASGPLRTGAKVAWQFKIAGATTEVEVVEAIPDRLFDLRWDDGQPFRITFETRQGATLVLASLKIWLEFAIPGDLIYDTFPDATYADR
jgi:catechol 2,3-dioxygenase-like lactoylglutathione lyase family enzyme